MKFLYIKNNKCVILCSMMRPLNGVIAAVSVATAQLITGNSVATKVRIIALLTAFTLIGAANIINDIFDIETDKTNKPNKPLITQKVTVFNAAVWAVVLLLFSLLSNLFLPPIALIIVIFASIIIVLYTPLLKSIPFWGNMAVSLVTAAGFLYGAATVGDISSGIAPFIIAFFINMLREIVKDLQDRKGDAAAGLNTAAVRYSLRSLKITYAALSIVTMSVVVAPYYLSVFNINYLLMVIFTVFPLLITGLVWMLEADEENSKQFGKISVLIKMSMLLGIIAFYVGV